MRCTKAIIAVGGLGGRRMPVAKAVEKNMLPVGNKPIIDYTVDSCIAAGITDILLVVSEQSQQIRTYYGHNPVVERYLEEHGHPQALAEVQGLATKANFTFVTQTHDMPYGTSVPLWLGREFVEPGESFLFTYADNIHYMPGDAAFAEFLREAERAHANTAMLVSPVPHETVSRYGIVDVDKRGEYDYFKRIIEKPKVEEAPTDLNNAGCFLFDDRIFAHAERSLSHQGKEHYVTDAINWFHEAGNDILVVTSKAEYLDCGTVEGWLAANNRIVGASKA